MCRIQNEKKRQKTIFIFRQYFVLFCYLFDIAQIEKLVYLVCIEKQRFVLPLLLLFFFFFHSLQWKSKRLVWIQRQNFCNLSSNINCLAVRPLLHCYYIRWIHSLFFTSLFLIFLSSVCCVVFFQMGVLFWINSFVKSFFFISEFSINFSRQYQSEPAESCFY